MLEGHTVEAIKTLKVNGENTQISWNPDIGAWLICSKNVSLVARGVEDVALYEGSKRHVYAILMAYCWFKMISSFKKKELDQFKQEIAD